MFYNELEFSILGLSLEPEAWTRLNLMLGLLSRRFASDDLRHVRVFESSMKITAGNTVTKIDFEKLFIFDMSKVQLENSISVARPKTFLVLDDFELSILGEKRYQLEPALNNRGFARRIDFYCSDRVDGADFITDCVVESELNQEQLNSFDYSDTMARFLVERHLESIGVYGRSMGKYKSGKVKYRKPKVVHVKRFVRELDNNSYQETDNVKFLDLSLRQIIEESS